MKFLQKDKAEKTVLVISDLHLSAGVQVDNKKNHLEDFFYDREFVDFLSYYSSGEYVDRELELVINGDFFDLLAVPFVKYFDDEFWSEKASLEKLVLIMEAHQDVMNALSSFLSIPKKRIVYLLGNHDAELVFESLQRRLLESFPEHVRNNFSFLVSDKGEYLPLPGVVIKHGHEYERAHFLQYKMAVTTAKDGTKYFLPPWGSYYVTRVINRFKEERSYINAVRPIKKFIINGLIYDTFFTIRFIFANFFFFFMVRFVYIFKLTKNLRDIWAYLKQELQLAIFKDEERILREYFSAHDNLKALIVGHTHMPVYREYSGGPVFINTGTWTKVYTLGFGMRTDELLLTYAQIDRVGNNVSMALNVWQGRNPMPFSKF